MDSAVHVLYRMFDDGKTQAGSAAFFGVALIYPVEAFKHFALLFRRNADPCICHSD